MEKLFLGFFFLGTVLGTALLAVFYAGSIKGTPNDMIAHTRKIFYPASADQHDTVLLEIVTFTRNVGNDFHLISKTYLGHLAEGRVRLLRGSGINTGANAATLRAGIQCT